MGAYNFKPQFEPAIQADEKRHTIRAHRKDGRRPKPGELLSLYVGMMQGPRPDGTKRCRLLKRRTCVKVQDIQISAEYDIRIDGIPLGFSEKRLLATSDGFTSYIAWMNYWNGSLPFEGFLIHWESDKEAAKRPREVTAHHRAMLKKLGNSPNLRASR